MITLSRKPAAWAAAVLALCAMPLAAGTFGDIASMGQKFPKVPKENQEGTIIVSFKAGVTDAQKNDKHRREGNLKLRDVKGTTMQIVQVSPDQTLDQALARYNIDASLVQYAEPNFIFRAQRLPSEPAFNLLWGMNNTGQTLGTPGADIRATLAWDLVTGSPNVAVMVIDSGVDYNHQDLAANIWSNAGEIAGNGIDDDGNGYIDDLRGIDVVNGDVDPMDDYGHGTHVAGTIGAVGNNALGVVGVNWSVKLIPCKILDATGNGSIADAVTCLNYAKSLKARGVNIVATNNSYGGLASYSQAMYDAIAAQPDILFVAAAGNFGTDNDTAPFYPANFELPNVISVAATDHTDTRGSFSDFGRRTVHVGAPGVNITSTVPFNNYSAANGTSMASPHVAGLAALLAAQDPTRDWRAIKNLILAGGDVRPTLSQTVTGRRINAATSTACSAKPVFSALKMPTAFTVGVPATVSALSIDCASAVGPVTVQTSAGESFTLADDGVAPDQAAGDGIFTATITPTLPFASLSFTSPTGTETVTMVDLTVTAVSGPAAANRGDSVSVNVTVANPSSMAAPATTVNLYLSSDSAITGADTLLGSIAVPALPAGASQALGATVTLPANLAVGPYSFGAIVDPTNLIDEAVETNNALAGNTVALGNVAIDLVTSGVSGPTTAFTGDAATFRATVTNAGSSPAPATQLNFYLSSDNLITAADTWIGSAQIAALAPGASQLATGSLPIPVSLPPGTYFIGAVADANNVVVETSELNNTAVGNTITTSTRPIDLTVSAVSGPGTARDMATVTLTATARNAGTATAPATTLRWYLSSDATITTADIPVASVAVPSLRGGGSQKLSVSVRIPASVPAGSYRLGAIVDPDNTVAETNNANNALAGGTIAVSYTVDLVMTAVAGPAAAATGQLVTLNGTVKNQGLAATPGNVTVGFYVSSDTSITTGDTLVATATIGPLAAGASQAVSVTAALNTSLREGSYYVGAIADPSGAVPESNEGNNALAGNAVAVSYGPDLVVTTVSGPATAARGANVTLNATVANVGTGSLGALSDQNVGATASTVRLGFYLSTNATITANDTFLGAVATPTIAAGQSQPVSLALKLPTNLTAGTYYIGAIADFSNGIRETNETNNALAGNTITITAQ